MIDPTSAACLAFEKRRTTGEGRDYPFAIIILHGTAWTAFRMDSIPSLGNDGAYVLRVLPALDQQMETEAHPEYRIL